MSKEIDWNMVSANLKALSNDKTRLWKVVESEIVKMVKESNPKDYKKILKENKYIIYVIIDGLVDKYQKILVEEIERLCE